MRVSMVSWSKSPTTLMMMAATARKPTMVPTKRESFLRSPPPMRRAMMTCPAEAKPMATKVKRLETSPPTDTAEVPALPMTLPTTIMSTML